MRLIVAPAKKMHVDEGRLDATGKPVHLERAREILAWMRGLDLEGLKALWACSDKVAAEGAAHLEALDLDRAATPAVLAYDGIQYKYMAPSVFDEDQVAYVQEHLRILSGFYGVLRPLDAVGPYRLELDNKARVAQTHDLYEYWGTVLHDEVYRGETCVVNLASLEYSKAIRRHLKPGETFVTCVFGELEGQKVVQKGVYAKMARGEMVRYAADVDARAPEDLVGFDRLGYAFCPQRSKPEELVFVRGPQQR